MEYDHSGRQAGVRHLPQPKLVEKCRIGLGFLISPATIFVHKICPQSTSFLCRKSATTHRLVEVVVQLRSLSITLLIGQALCTVTSSAGDGITFTYLHRHPFFAILILIVSSNNAVSEQYDRQHRDCRELHPPEASRWLAYCGLLRLVVQLPS